mgnify:CR=1 FL=1|jgi:hypothetical protein
MRKNILILSIFLLGTLSAWSQSADDIKKALPSLENWVMTPEVEMFNEETLFERINGAAENFLLFDFREMLAVEYKKGDTYISMQVYVHASPLMAFGVYAAERSPELSYIPVGTEGYQEGTVLNFLTRNVYVKIESPFDSPEMQKDIRTLAERFARNLGEPGTLPGLLACFPEQNKLAHSEKYITSGFLGHSFLNQVVSCIYQKGDKQSTLFLMDAGTADKAKEILTKYAQLAEQSPSDIQEGLLTIRDPYNGAVELFWNGKIITGIQNEAGLDAPGLLRTAAGCATGR